MRWVFCGVIIAHVVVFVVCAVAVMRKLYFGHSSDVGGERRYVALLCDLFLQHDDEIPFLTFVTRNDSAECLGRVMEAFSRLVAEYAPRQVKEMVVDAAVEEFFVGRMLRSGGYDNVANMAVLSAIPLSAEGMEEVAGYRCENRFSDYFATVIRLNSEPQRVHDVLAEHSEMNIHLAARLAVRLSRDRARIDWRRCYDSNSVNLRLVGLSLTGIYHIAEAEESVYDMLWSEHSEVGDAAVRCLVLLNLSLEHNGLIEYLGRLDEQGRRAMYRMFVRTGYSRRSLRRFAEYEAERNSGLADQIKREFGTRRRSLAGENQVVER